MDLHEATYDQIANELTRRNNKFMLILVQAAKLNGAEMHCGNLNLEEMRNVISAAHKVMQEGSSDSVRLFKRTMVNGKIVNEEELETVEDLEKSLKEPNEVGDFDPWKKLEDSPLTEKPVEKKEEDKKENKEKENNDPNYDPWVDR